MSLTYDEQEEAKKRLELDRRVFALKFAVEQVRFSMNKDDKPPIYEETLESAREYYKFLNGDTSDPDGALGDVDNGS